MLDSHAYISTQIEKIIPQFVRMEYPNFVAFIKSYYEYMEKQDAPYHFIANTLNFADVDRTSIALLDEFAKNFLNPLPDVIFANNNNIATLVKNIEQYYSARGSEKAIEFLFRIFEYKDDPTYDIEFYYPSYDILRVSDGKWVNEKSIKIIDPPSDVINWEAGELTGQNSGAKAVIDEIKLYQSTSDVSIAEIFLLEYDVIHTINKFECGEDIVVLTIDNETSVISQENIFQDITLTSSGKYYYTDQRIKVQNSASGEDAYAVVDNIKKSNITALSIVHGGLDYVVDDKIYSVSDDFGSGVYGKVTEVDGSGTITEVELTFGGHDYYHMPRIEILSTAGSGAVIMSESDEIGQIETIEVRNFGINYLTVDTTITFNTMFRIYDVNIDFDIGETITGFSSGAVGTVEYWNEEMGIMSILVISGVFTDGEYFTGSRWGGTAYIYDQSTASGTLSEGCLCEYNGRYINNDGHISSLKYIQDSYFYQLFSYMLKTDISKVDWVDYINHSHPAGTIGFSYDDVISKYVNESSAGFIGPTIDVTEFYKFAWLDDQYHGGHERDAGNTQMKQYKDIIIDEVININNNEWNRTKFTFGSEITITTT